MFTRSQVKQAGKLSPDPRQCAWPLRRRAPPAGRGMLTLPCIHAVMGGRAKGYASSTSDVHPQQAHSRGLACSQRGQQSVQLHHSVPQAALEQRVQSLGGFQPLAALAHDAPPVEGRGGQGARASGPAHRAKLERSDT